MGQQEETGAGARDASAELIKRSVAMILAQTRAGAGTALLMGGTLGAVFVPAVGWWRFLAWYVALAVAMLARQP